MRALKVVDVFTTQPFLGNPVAVVLDGEGLDSNQMQTIARWTNLSETTFLLPATDPRADYQLRIFTPRNELPFAGHPTLGSAYAALESKRFEPRHGVLTQQCGVGLVSIAVDDSETHRRLTFELPPAKITSITADDVIEIEATLGQPIVHDPTPAIINVGPVWIVAQLANDDAVLSLRPHFARSAKLERRLGAGGITVFGRSNKVNLDIEVRSFAPSSGIDEDPVCGSGNGSVAAYQFARGLLPTEGCQYTATQGRCIGRDGRIAVEVDSCGNVKVGGNCVTCVDGSLQF